MGKPTATHLFEANHQGVDSPDDPNLFSMAEMGCTPVVADSAARDALYPTPVGDEKVFNKTTGVVERYDNTVVAWVSSEFAFALTAYDDFERANQFGLGTAKTGQVWAITGADQAFIQIESGRYTMGPAALVGTPSTGYASLKLTTAPIRYGAKFSFALGPGGTVNPLAVISSSDATFTIQNMLHFILSPTGFTPTVWVAGVSHAVATTSDQRGGVFATPLLTDGTVYELWITVNAAANTAHIDLPDGSSIDISDPSLGASYGSLITWEHTYGNTSTAVSRFESVACYSATAQTVSGPLSVPAGIRGPIGNVSMAGGFFSQVGINTQAPVGQLHILTTSTANPPPDGLRISSTVNKVVMRLKTTANGQPIELWFDEGQANPVKIYSAGNSNDLRVMNNNTDRLIMPLSTTAAIQWPLNPMELAGAALAASTGSRLVLGGTQQTTVGANGAASALTALPLGYAIAFVGATKVVFPYYNA